ncbi:MAG: 3-deoxy-7-phosphoheptulonate synthase [Gammaproteobacteria bacterium]|jgi:3-deoxy-7-phosphoheptulonate synthase|nr:3-deoxy-7-phosphoheptulonate synthase [Gammaproteobacteria bacterium]
MSDQIHNINVIAKEKLPSPKTIKAILPLTQSARETVINSRNALVSILDRKDKRLIVVVGPCSIHDIDAAKDYASRLKHLSDDLSDVFHVLMRVYFEKPRTTVGWKGLINDPNIDDTFQIDKGVHIARSLLIHLNEIGIPVATEALDPIMPQYLGDLISWTAIGARTAESQTHREIASGLSTPVGFKNGTDGSLSVAINAIKSARDSHHFLGLNDSGQVTVYKTKGNRYSHVVLRGGPEPNFDKKSIALCEKKLKAEGLPPRIMIDCSHGNSNKDFNLQPMVAHSSIDQVLDYNHSIIGFMLESNIEEGNQQIPEDLSELKYGVSLTDACMNWETTEALLSEAAERLRAR